MKRAVALFFIFLLALSARSQTFSLIPAVELQGTFVTVHSNKEAGDINLRPLPGINGGVTARLALKEKNNIDLSVTFKHRRNKGEPIAFTNVQGEEMGEVNTRIMNNYVGLGLAYQYKFPFNLFIGAGVEFNLLASSKTKLKHRYIDRYTIHGEPIDTKFNNYYFRTFNIGIPVMVSYEIKRVVFTAKFETGILSRIKDSEIQEREQVLSFGIGYVLVKDGKVRSGD